MQKKLLTWTFPPKPLNGHRNILAQKYHLWQFLGSLTWSKLSGNTGEGFEDSVGHNDPFDTPNWFVNRDGNLSWDRPVMIKLQGSVILPADIILSGYYQFFSGTPWGRTLEVQLPMNPAVFEYPGNFVSVELPAVSKWENGAARLRIVRERECVVDARLLAIARLEVAEQVGLGDRRGLVIEVEVDASPANLLQPVRGPEIFVHEATRDRKIENFTGQQIGAELGFVPFAIREFVFAQIRQCIWREYAEKRDETIQARHIIVAIREGIVGTPASIAVLVRGPKRRP